jgi:hypothetical protein
MRSDVSDREFFGFLSAGAGGVLTLFGWPFAGVGLYGLGMLVLGAMLCGLAALVAPTRRVALAAGAAFLVGLSPLAVLVVLTA